MNIKGEVHLLFEQSGTYKREFMKLGYKAFDYDLRNNFGVTDYQIDIFKEINLEYEGVPSLFNTFKEDDLLMAFFPCVHFCDAKTMIFRGVSITDADMSVTQIMERNIALEQERHEFFLMLMKLVTVVMKRNLRLIIENPWARNGHAFLQVNFLPPTIVDYNRLLRGDYFRKPTAYWFFNCVPTTGYTEQINLHPLKIANVGSKKTKPGECDERRSMMSSDYARNMICDFIIGKVQQDIMPQLFDSLDY